ncbi:MAG: mycofactocin-coupled SDR family oxidoreductase [Acidimicrobiales bacterium]
MGRVDGKVAFITGAARGQGRSHAVRLAGEGADIIAIDLADQIATVPYPMATMGDLEQTARLVEEAGQRCVAVRADVRDIHALAAAADQGAEALGGIDIVIANAGILPFASGAESLDQAAASWSDAVGVMLTGVFNTLRVTQERLIDQGRGGSVVIISSTAGLLGSPGESGGILGYTAAKHGVVGLMRGYAKLLGPHSIRVNTIHPTAVETPMIINEAFAAFVSGSRSMNELTTRVLPVNMIQASDVSDAIVWLVSDEAKFVTGVTLPVDAGVTCP